MYISSKSPSEIRQKMLIDKGPKELIRQIWPKIIFKERTSNWQECPQRAPWTYRKERRVIGLGNRNPENDCQVLGMCVKDERKCNKSCGLDVKCSHNIRFEHMVPECGTIWEDYGARLEEACRGGVLSGFVGWPYTLFPDCEAALHFCHHLPSPGHARL